MDDSILNNVKKMLGFAVDYTAFDPDIILFINAALNVLTQIGVGPRAGFTIEDNMATWTDFFGPDKRLSLAKTYIYAKVRILFDPPQNAAALNAMQAVLTEYEARLNWIVDFPIDPPLEEALPF